MLKLQNSRRIPRDSGCFVPLSYYETIGARVIRTDRGNLNRPSTPMPPAQEALLMLGLNHEQQHQELLATDIKYILGNNRLLPVYDELPIDVPANACAADLISVNGGIYRIGHTGVGFCFDNELSSGEYTGLRLAE